MKKVLRNISGVIIVLIVTLIWIFYNYDENNASMLTTSNVISNAKIEWGVKRAENHERPDLGKKNTELMEKYKRYLFRKCR